MITSPLNILSLYPTLQTYRMPYIAHCGAQVLAASFLKMKGKNLTSIYLSGKINRQDSLRHIYTSNRHGTSLHISGMDLFRLRVSVLCPGQSRLTIKYIHQPNLTFGRCAGDQIIISVDETNPCQKLANA